MGIGLGCLEIVLEEGNREEWFSSQFIIVLSAISAVSLIYFVINELQHEKPLVNLRLLRERQFIMSCIAYLIIGVRFPQLLFSHWCQNSHKLLSPNFWLHLALLCLA